MRASLVDEYAQSLAALEGHEFQLEVTTRLESMILGFQTIPAKPHGDAGLDGLSHHGERGYCCYGLEYDHFKSRRALEKAIIEKFCGDLRRLLELDFHKRVLVRRENPEMGTILPRGRRLKHIELIANWFESHRVLGPLRTRFEEYVRASDCRYVDPSASVVVVGPEVLANRYAVDEVTIHRARQRVLIKKVHEVAINLDISDPEGFDKKMQKLRHIRPQQASAIDRLAEVLRSDWRTALAFDRYTVRPAVPPRSDFRGF